MHDNIVDMCIGILGPFLFAFYAFICLFLRNKEYSAIKKSGLLALSLMLECGFIGLDATYHVINSWLPPNFSSIILFPITLYLVFIYTIYTFPLAVIFFALRYSRILKIPVASLVYCLGVVWGIGILLAMPFYVS